MERRLAIPRKSPAPPEEVAQSTAAGSGGDDVSWHVLNELASLKDVVQQVINLEKERTNMRLQERVESLETMTRTHESRLTQIESQVGALLSAKTQPHNVSIATSVSENQPAISELEDRISTLESQPSFDLRLHVIEDKLSEVSKIAAIEERLKVITEQQVQALSDAQMALSQVNSVLPKSVLSMPLTASNVSQQQQQQQQQRADISVQRSVSNPAGGTSMMSGSAIMPTTPFPSPDSSAPYPKQYQPQLQPRFSIPSNHTSRQSR
eukprot:TRINITY_DN22350_c0_g1_i1.p1 TRINITY_DN22350_c0_g1~~TRINITY_DN22350_c0_g1_i1.p1  ORF type:complete len:307 (+),score=74.71 TRINITY_DN22350_c0_g1_i1:124-921(+)